MTGEVLAAAEQLAEEGIQVEVIKLIRLLPLASDLVLQSIRKTKRLVAEEVIAAGSIGTNLAALAEEAGILLHKLILLNAGNQFVPHGTIPQLRERLGINCAHIVTAIREAVT